MMYRYIYVSRALIGGDRATLNAIVETSAVRNAAAGITGELWFDGANFAQVLEGDQVAIAATVQRILADPRHTDIEIVTHREIRHAMFGRWSMALANDGQDSSEATAFLIGFAKAEHSDVARRLYDIAIASLDRM